MADDDLQRKEYVDSSQEREARKLARSERNAVGEVSITRRRRRKTSIRLKRVPMRHQLRLGKRPAKGESRDVSLVYDGSDEEKTVRAISTTAGR